MLKQYNVRLGTAYASTIISISLVLFLLGVFSYLVLNARNISNNIKENIQFTLELSDDFKDVEHKQFQKKLEAKPYVYKTRFVSKKEGAEIFTQEIGEDFEGFLDYNPLPAILEVNLNADYLNVEKLEEVQKELSGYEHVAALRYEKSILEAINQNASRISVYILIFCALLGVISFVLINNTIRLMVYSKRFLLRTMTLIGATNAFIRRPFLISSLFYGLNAGLVASIFLFQLIFYIQDEISGVIDIYNVDVMVPLFLGLLVLGMLLSVVSTKFALDKYLNLSKERLYY